MKHFSFLFSFVLFTISANCQLDKKNWLVGGTGNFFTYKDNYTAAGQPTITGRLTEINLAANIGYFFTDKIAVGLRPGIKSLKSNGANSASVLIEDVKLYIGPFARYYFLNKGKQFNILIDGSYQFGLLSNFEKGTTQNASIMTGAEVFFNTSVGIEFLAGYLYQKNNLANTQLPTLTTRNGLYFSIGFQLHLIKD